MVHVSIDFSKVVKVSMGLLSVDGGIILCRAQTGAEPSVRSDVNKRYPGFMIIFAPSCPLTLGTRSRDYTL
jgi:hypothetical protein